MKMAKLKLIGTEFEPTLRDYESCQRNMPCYMCRGANVTYFLPETSSSFLPGHRRRPGRRERPDSRPPAHDELHGVEGVVPGRLPLLREAGETVATNLRARLAMKSTTV